MNPKNFIYKNILDYFHTTMINILKKSNKKGFTLIELIIVIAIIGILVVASMMNYGQNTKKAREARVLNDMENIITSANVYYADENKVFNNTELSTVCQTFKDKGYMNECPTAPHPSGKYYITTDSNGKIDVQYISSEFSMDYLDRTNTTKNKNL